MKENLFLSLLIICTFIALDNVKGNTTVLFTNKLAAFQSPASPLVTYNFNPGWKFAFGDMPEVD